MLSANSLKFTFGLQPNFSLVLQYLPPGFQLQSDNKIWDKKTVDLHNSVQVLQRQFVQTHEQCGFVRYRSRCRPQDNFRPIQ